MKKLIALFACVWLSLATLGITYDVSDNGDGTCSISYAKYVSGAVEIPESFNGLTVTRIGSTAFADCTNLVSVTIPNSVTSIDSKAFFRCRSLTSVTIPNSVTNIGGYAFYGCSSLASVTIPNSVTCIGVGTFCGCSALTSVTIPNSVTLIVGAFNECPLLYDTTTIKGLNLVDGWVVGYNSDCPTDLVLENVRGIANYAFSGSSSLTSVTIPNSVTRIGQSTFSNCSSLTSVTIPNSVTSIDSEAFFSCSSLTSMTIPNSVTNIGYYAFSGCSSLASVVILDGVTNIGLFAFYNCSNLTSVTMPDSVTSIGWSAFSGCSGLTSVTIPSSVTSIGDSAFSSCSGLTSVTIPSSVTSIGDSAFSGCSGLTAVTIPDSVTSIGRGAFSGCCGLMSVTIPESVTEICTWAFAGCDGLADSEGFIIVKRVLYDYVGNNAILTIPDRVTSIDGSAFYDCSSLTSVTIPNGVTSIGQCAFFGCRGLTSVTIPDSVTSIGIEAFRRCRGLTSVTIPDSVMNIGYYAFRNCGLSEVSVSARTEIDESAFDSGVVITRRPADEPAPTYSPLSYANLKWATNTNPTIYEEGKALALAAPGAVAGYTFAGWTPAQITADMTGAQTVTANWTANRYEVIYDANGGLGEMANGEFVYDAEEMLAENSFTREGYRFAGWSDLKDKNCADWLPSSVISNLTATADGRVTLYAVWSPNSYSVGFNPNGGSGVMAEQAYTYGEAQTLAKCAFTRKGYAFAGWRIGGEDVAETLLDGAVVSNLTASANGRVELYADWKIVESESAPALPERLKGDGLIVHYEFNGDARDSSGNGNNGVLHGPVLSVDRFGDSDQAYCFDGDDDWIEVAHSESLSLITNEITVSLWIKPTKWWDKAGSSPAIPFVCKSNKSYAEGSFRVFAEKHNGDAVFRGVENATYSSDDRLVLDEWQHIVIVYAGATHVYRNGALLASAATACEVHRYQDVMAIGRDIVGGVTQFFAGEMDDLRIYNFGLTDDEVNMLYAVESVRVVDSLPALENPTRAEIEAVLTGAKDVGLAANITSAADYADFRTWACAVKARDGDKVAGVDVVMAAPTAWLSYALGSETLIEETPTNGQMRVEKFEPAPNAGWFDFTVSIGDIGVASSATKENLKKVFSLEGGETLDALSSTNIDISFGTPENGKVKFTAGPNARNADAKTFFMKVKMTP